MRKGQTSVETMFLIAFATMLLIPAAILFYQFLGQSSESILDNHVKKIGNSFAENVHLMYNYGNKAKVVNEYSFPPYIQNMSIQNNNQLVITTQIKENRNDHVFFLQHNTTAIFLEDDWIEGDKTFAFETIKRGEVVSITRVA